MPHSAPWPFPGDYTAAVQNPQSCFTDPELRNGEIAKLSSGFPRRWCGKFAIVYQLEMANKKCAVRCFIKAVSDQDQRYRLLQEHISKFSISALSLPLYLPQGIWVSG